MGSLTTSCMATPLMVAGSGGSGGLVLNGVLGLVAESGTVRSYSVKAPPLPLSDEPGALMAPPAPKGVLLNEGNAEKAYSDVPFGRVGGPEKGCARPWASRIVPW